MASVNLRQGADRASAHSCDRICWRVSNRFPHSGAGSTDAEAGAFRTWRKNPVIVFDDADLERALDAVAFMIWSLNGERCTSSSRVLIQSSIHDEFVAKLKSVSPLFRSVTLDPSTVIGPLIHPVHCEKVRSYEAIARSAGADVTVGGLVSDRITLDDESCFVRPMLFSDAENDMTISQEEILGQYSPQFRSKMKPTRFVLRTMSITASPDTCGLVTPVARIVLPVTSMRE